MYELGEKLKLAREAKRYSQVQLANLIGKSPSMISNYESSMKAPSIETLIELAKVLDVSLDYLTGIDSRRSVVVEGLSSRQMQTIIDLVTEFREKKKYPGLTQRQHDILNSIMIEFNTSVRNTEE